MKRTAAGLIGGLVGGTVKLIIDEVLFATGVSPVNTVGAFSRLFLRRESSLIILTWILYILGTAALGWLISLVFNKLIFNYFSSGIIIGVSLWVVMNIIFSLSGTATPTWYIGNGAIISDLITHSILGVIIAYTISKTGVEVKD